MQIVEPVFANIRTYKKMNRFTLHTKEKVILLKLDFVSLKKVVGMVINKEYI
jgi:hypothetical protein